MKRLTALALLLALALTAAAQADGALVYAGSMRLDYAECFSVDYYEGGYAMIRIVDGDTALVVPEGMPVPEGLDGDVLVLRQPLQRIYLAATAAMSLFDALGAVDAVRLSGLRAGDWTVAAAREAMERGGMLYAGRYSAPDYELLVREGCDLAVESTMILHAPRVREVLGTLGIPVLMDRSSYEPHPLGRTEWIRLYGVLLGREDAADALMAEKKALLEAAAAPVSGGGTVAFFMIDSQGRAVVRGGGDYIPAMIGMAGGVYVPGTLPGTDGTRAGVPVTMEDFYAACRDADYIIYNAGTMGRPLASLSELVAMNPLFSGFRAVREGNVWCVTADLYQSTADVIDFVADVSAMLDGRTDGMRFMVKVE